VPGAMSTCAISDEGIDRYLSANSIDLRFLAQPREYFAQHPGLRDGDDGLSQECRSLSDPLHDCSLTFSTSLGSMTGTLTLELP
jgi:hypothetical protein